MPDFSYEFAASAKGFMCICGIDEAGRGPLAGPVCAAAAVLPLGLEIKGLDDSKKLSEKKRLQLYEVITAEALDYSIAFADREEIDRLNILNAALLAMERAAAGLKKHSPDFALIDGNRAPGNLICPCMTIIKGDGISASIAAASVLAKVSRDRVMISLDEKYPQYGFAAHKGYPTALHYERLAMYGPCDQHRLTFLKKMPHGK